MSDPHVVSLTYRLTAHGGLHFGRPAPVEYSTDSFRVRLEGSVVKAEMLKHCASEAEARAVVEPFLRAWEVAGALEYADGTMRFDFTSSDVIDRDPRPSKLVEGSARMTLGGGQVSATGIVYRNKYPEPLGGFRVTPDVETLLSRYRLYCEGKEPLAAMAYACLTLIQSRGGTKSPKKLGPLIGVEAAVLKKLGELSSTVGDELTARKFQPGQATRAFSLAETHWMESVIRVLIRRVGELAVSTDTAQKVVSMKDLPSLP